MADVNSNLDNWSATASSNSPSGTTNIGTGLDDNLRQIQATVREYLATKGADIASAATTDLSTATGNRVDITGTVTITAFGTLTAGMWKILKFTGALTLTHNGTSLILPGAANITTAAGDFCMATSLGSGNWEVNWYQPKTGFAVVNSFTDSIFRVIGSGDATKKLAFEVDGLTTATTRTLTAQDATGSIALTSEFAYLGLPGATGRLLLPNDYISGFGLTTASTTTYDIAAGQAMDSTNTTNIIGSAITAKSQSAWAAGSSAGGKLSAAAMANNTWYYWFALWKTVDGTVDYGFDVATTPTQPSGYSKYRYIGARKTALAATTWDTFIQHGDEVLWSTPPATDLSGTVATASRTLQTVNVPALKVLWKGNVYLDSGAAGNQYLYITDPAVADVAPGTGAPPASPLATIGVNGTASQTFTAHASSWTNTSSQIGIRSANATPTVRIQTTGWIDPRGTPV